MHSSLRSSGLLLGVTLAACGGSAGSDRDPALRTEIRDSAGIRIVDNVLPSEPVVWRRLAEAPSVMIPPGEGDDALLQVIGAERTSDRSIMVVTFRGHPILLFGPDGTFLRVLARRGQGPGEIRSLDGLYARGPDSLRVYDPATSRLTTFTPGGMAEEVSLVGRSARFVSGVVGEVPPGRLLLRRRGNVSALMQQGNGVARDTSVFVLLGTDPMQEADTLLSLPGTKIAVLAREVDGQMLPGMAMALDIHDAWAVVGSQRVYVVNSDAVDVRVLDTVGLKERWRLAVPTIPVRNDDIPAMKAAVGELMGESIIPAFEPVWASVSPPSVRPAVAGILRSRDGTLWVERYSLVTDSLRLYHVFGPEGHYVGDVNVPRRFRVLSADTEWVLGVSRDEDGLESVELYPLIEPAR